MTIDDLLSRVPLFNNLMPAEIARIAQGTREVRVGKGGLLFHKGDECLGFHLIVCGQVKLAFTSPQGDEKVVDIVGRGQTFGEALMFMEKSYVVFAQALSDSLLLHISKSVIFEEIERDPVLGRRMIAGLSVRLHQIITDLEAYSMHSGKQRLIGYLLRAVPSEESSPEITITLPTSKCTIASRLNLSQEHFSRILHELAQERLIVVDGRRIRIPDVARLRSHEC